MNNQRKLLCGLCMVIVALCAFQMLRREKYGCGKESYRLSPAGVTIVEKEGNCNLFNLPNKLECVPGAPNGSAYTVGLTPGGLCGAQKCVDAAASYKIDKIGGSPLA